MPDSFISPTVHKSESVPDALEMLDSHIPLTYQEKKLIVQSLYDLAFREGARQGRQAGIESVHSEIRTMASDYRLSKYDGKLTISRTDVADLLESLLPPDEPREYVNPTQAIRDNLAEKARQRDGF